MKNNNQAIIKKITGRKLSFDKKRNFFIIAAVALTSLLITSVFSIGMSMYETVQAQRIRLEGTVAHAWVNRITGEQAERLKNLDYVKTAGYHSGIGIGNGIDLSLRYLDKMTWELLISPAYTGVTGNYPIAEDEIMLSRKTLEELGITQPEAGMEINISFFPINNNIEILFDNVYNGSFRLTGWFTSYDYDEKAFVAKAMADKLQITTVNAGVIFTDMRDIASYIERLKTDLNNQNIVAGHHVYAANFGSWLSTIIALSLAVALFILAGALLIYNVLYISVTNDIRFYGLLKTIGTTPRQIKNIVIGQAIRLSVIGIPIGFICSAFASYILVPTVIASSDVETGAIISFSPLIYIAAALFVLLTTLLGAITPAKKAANIAPVEAAKYTDGNIKSSSAVFQTKGRTHRMALRNIFRDKKRAIMVFISLILGITVFMVSTIFVSSIDIDKFADMIKTLKYDFTIRNSTIDKSETEIVFDSRYMNTAKSLPGLSEMSVISQTIYLLDNESHGMVYGIDKAGFMDLLDILGSAGTSLDVDAFERGDFALVKRTGWGSNDNGETVKVDYRYMQDITISFDMSEAALKMPVGAFVPDMNDMDYFSGNIIRAFSMSIDGSPTIIVSNAFLQSAANDPLIIEININVEKDRDGLAYELLNEAARGNKGISMESRWQIRQNVKDAKTLLNILGYGISLILVLIGVLNFVNVMSVGVVIRKHEFAVLESVGMSKRQLRITLVFEGLGYAVIALLLAFMANSGIVMFFYQAVLRQMDFMAFSVPFIPFMIAGMAIVAVCLAAPILTYKSINKLSLVERLKLNE